MSVSIYGLAEHEGETMAVFLAGIDCGDFVVVNGEIQIPTDGSVGGGLMTDHYLAQVSAMDRNWGVNTIYTSGYRLPVVVGYRYASRGQLVRPVKPEDVGAMAGPGFGKFKRNHIAAFMVSSTGPLRVGTDFSRLHTLQRATPGERIYTPTELSDGILVESIDDDSTYDSMLCWEVDSPYSAKIMAVGGFIKTEDR